MINNLKLKATQKPLDIFFGFKFLLHVTTLNPLSQEGGVVATDQFGFSLMPFCFYSKITNRSINLPNLCPGISPC